MTTAELNIPEGVAPDEAQLLLALKLFESHRASLGAAAEMVGVTRPQFMELLGRHGVPIFDYEEGQLEQEVAE